MNTIDNIREAWYLLAAIAAGIGGLYGWFRKQKKAKADSSAMLYEQLEILKKKVLLQIAKEVNDATAAAEKEKIIQGLRLHCPDCYDTFIQKRSENDSPD